MAELTEKQKRFCEEYLIDLNATQSAIRAGYSEKTSYSIGCENLIKPEIQNYIAELQADKSDELNITFNDMLRIELSIAQNGEKDSDKLKAVDQISKKLGFYEKNNEQIKPESLNIINLGQGIKPNETTT